MMELKDLRYFVAVAEELSFTRGAARERVSQPALSRRIKGLEELLGVELFIREQGVRLSPAGERLLPRARKVLGEAVKAELSVRQFAQCRLHRLDIGFLSGPVGAFLSSSLLAYEEESPEVKVVLHELSPGEQLEQLRAGALDIALVGHASGEVEREFDLFRLAELPLHVLVGPGHALAGRERVGLEDLRGEKMARLSERKFPGTVGWIAELCRTRGFSPDWGAEADGLAGAMMQVAGGRGVIVLPAGAERIGAYGVVSIPLIGLERAAVFQAAVAREEKRSTVREFLQTAKRHEGLLSY